MNSNALAIFDFCDTLFNGQSVSCFIDFLESRLPFYEKIACKIKKKLNTIPSSDSKRYKEYLLGSYRHVTEEEFERLSVEFFDNVVLKKLHQPVLDKLLEHKNNGDIVVVASGGFENYLKHFKGKFNVDYLFCTKLKFEKKRFTGFVDGNECLGVEKARQVKSFFRPFNIDWARSSVYSDHENDLPLFELAGRKVLVQTSRSLDWKRDLSIFEIWMVDALSNR